VLQIDWSSRIGLLMVSLFFYRKNTLEDAGELLKGEALDAALEEATRDCPDLLQLVDQDDTCQEDLFAEYEALKDICKEDEKYLQTLRHSIRTLK